MFFNVLFLLSIKKKKKINILFFYLEKVIYFDFFLFNKKFIISHKKNKKTNYLNSENKLFLVKS